MPAIAASLCASALLVGSLCGVPARADEVVALGFNGLSANEVLTWSAAVRNDRGTIVLYGLDPVTRLSRELTVIADFNMGKVELAENGKKAYFVVLASEGPPAVDELWVADGVTGLAYPLLRTGASFAVSPDGRTVCYQDAEYAARHRSVPPRIDLYDVRSGKVSRRVDFADRRYAGTETVISFDPRTKAFHVEFERADRFMGAVDISAR